jgi:hypothetical protein
VSNEGEREPWSKELVLITPATARVWLATRNDENYRKPSPARAHLYAERMRGGLWDEGHPDAIQFDWFGSIGNGQHRLLAIIESGVSLLMFVERGINPKHFEFSDNGGPRTDAHRLKFLGFRRDVSLDKAAAVARGMLEGLKGWTSEEVTAFAKEHQDLIAVFVLEMAKAKPNRAPVTAAFCKAALEHPESKVLASARRYATEDFRGATDPLFKLYKAVQEFKHKGGHVRDLYAQSVCAIRAELEGRPLKHLWLAQSDFTRPGKDRYVVPAARERALKGVRTRLLRSVTTPEPENGDEPPARELPEQERRGPPPGPPSKPRFSMSPIQ